MSKTYNAVGKVLGECFTGGTCYFSCKKLSNYKTKEELFKVAHELFESGELDAGFGFRSLRGALLEVEEVETIVIDGKNYIHSEFELHEIGEIPENDFDMLMFKLV